MIDHSLYDRGVIKIKIPAKYLPVLLPIIHPEAGIVLKSTDEKVAASYRVKDWETW